MTISAVSYVSSFVVSIVALLSYLRRARQEKLFVFLTVGLFIQSVWLLLLSLSYFVSIPNRLLFIFEAFCYFGWIVTLNISLTHFSWPRISKPSIAMMSLGVVFFILVISDAMWQLSAGASLVALGMLSLAVLATASLEQIVRAHFSIRFFKLLGLGLGALFLISVLIYSQRYLSSQIDPLLWQSRSIVILLSSILLSVAALVFAEPSQVNARRLSLSRPLVFYSASLLATGALILVFALGALVIRNVSGSIGLYLYAFTLVVAVFSLISLSISRTVRSSLQVFLNKHFFNHKYDYRKEWLKIVENLSANNETGKEFEVAFGAIARVFHCQSGSIWLSEGDHFTVAYDHHSPYELSQSEVLKLDPWILMMVMQDWVFCPQAEKQSALANNNELLPEWIQQEKSLWLIVPIKTEDQMDGFVLLNEPDVQTHLMWEDLDLLKSIGQQLAFYLRLHQQQRQLVEAQQFDAYTKLTAFIMHDLNNLIAQQALVVKNAEKHKDNPAFINDMILTISNSVKRMESLLQKLSTAGDDYDESLSIVDILRQVIKQCERLPQPELLILCEDVQLKAKRDRLVLALKHLVKNAQEATPDDGKVSLTLFRSDDHELTLTITDTGAGMDEDFIRHRLFRAFESTKSDKGMGIGVYLTKNYLEQIGASISVTSKVGEGTTFCIAFAERELRERE